MRIQGKVVENVIIDNHTSKYKIKSRDGTYIVKAYGKEAIKDYLFIREGQILTIDGELVDNYISKEKAFISLRPEDSDSYGKVH